MAKGMNKLNLQLGGFKSSVLDSCKTPKVSIAGKLQIVPAPVDDVSFFPAKQWNSLFSIFLHIADVGQIFLITVEVETRILNDKAEEDEEEKEEASRWTGLSVQSVSPWTGLGLGRLRRFAGCSPVL